MKTVTSISGGKTSAYLAANYPADELVFSLVRSSDTRIMYKDRTLAKKVEDRIKKDFIGTLEDDIIIKTIFDLEQYLGKKINWVTGLTYDEIINGTSGFLPSVLRRYCTSKLKIEPIFYWCYNFFNSNPVYMNIGYRATFEKHKTGRHKGKNKWVDIKWRIPKFPLIEDNIFKDQIENFWELKPVQFAKRNNCIGCFHRPIQLLKEISLEYPEKFEWFVNAEKIQKGTWKKNISYENIKKLKQQRKLFDFSNNCGSGFCGF